MRDPFSSAKTPSSQRSRTAADSGASPSSSLLASSHSKARGVELTPQAAAAAKTASASGTDYVPVHLQTADRGDDALGEERLQMPRRWFRWWNALVAAVQWATTILTWMWWHQWLSAEQREAATVTLYWNTERRGAPGEESSRTTADRVGQVQVVWLQAAFVALSALDHTAAVWQHPYPPSGRPNWLRWIEYSISAPIMMMQLLLLNGNRDLRDCLVVLLLTALTMTAGLVAEYNAPAMTRDYARAPQEDARHRRYAVCSFVAGCVPFAAVWAMYLWPPFLVQSPPYAFVWVAMGATFVSTLSFPAWQGWHLFRRLSSARYEIGFGILSLVSKQALLWITSIGFMHV